MRIRSSLKYLTIAFVTLITTLPIARAEVERIEIFERVPFADGKAFGNVGAYERIRGRLTFAIDPNAPENQTIVDVKLAPRDAQGRVVFSADFLLMKPLDPTRANGRLLYEVNNRGGLGMLGIFNDARNSNLPATSENAGNGFLFEQGYTLLWSGWTWDVPPGENRLRADLPTAGDAGRIILGKVNGEIAVNVPTTAAQHIGMLAVGYPPAVADDPDAVLTVRSTALGNRTVIPRAQWRFGRKQADAFFYDPTWITFEGGFKPGLIYALTYTAREPRVVGLGLAAIRDAVSFFRHNRTDRVGALNPLIEPKGELPKWALAFGHSQSGRVLNAMLYGGFVSDGRGRLVFDGIYSNMSGSGRGSFNYRFAQSSRHFSPDIELDYPTDWFPFSTAKSTDPVTKETASIIDRADAMGQVPKLFTVNGASEYWARGASLSHTSVDGKSDLTPDKNTRVYMMAGAQHLANRGGDRGQFASCRNPLDYRPLSRALLLHLDAWATLKREPPANAVAHVGDESAGTIIQYVAAFPKIPSARLPSQLLEPPRLDFGARFINDGIAENIPPKVGQPYAVRVPMPDEDGLDKGGLRLPEIQVPLGTYTGWNLQNAATGAPERLGRWDGSFFPFSRGEIERKAMNDQRRAIPERYASREKYVEAYASSALAMAEKELILAMDVNPMIERAGQFYDRIMAHSPDDESCAYINPPPQPNEKAPNGTPPSRP